MKTIKQEFEEMAQEYHEKDSIRELVIQTSRNMLKLAKQAIYDTHKQKYEDAKTKLQQARQEWENSLPKKQELKDQETNALQPAIEEYIEALLFQTYVQEQKILLKEEINAPEDISSTIYLQALSDFTGELAREALEHATEKETNEIKKIIQTCEDIQEGFLLFNFRNSELRRKNDALQKNIQKIKQLYYEVTR